MQQSIMDQSVSSKDVKIEQTHKRVVPGKGAKQGAARCFLGINGFLSCLPRESSQRFPAGLFLTLSLSFSLQELIRRMGTPSSSKEFHWNPGLCEEDEEDGVTSLGRQHLWLGLDSPWVPAQLLSGF